MTTIDQSELAKIQRWRDRAEECRVDAEAMHDPESKRILLGVADIYERLADRYEARLGIKSRLDE